MPRKPGARQREYHRDLMRRLRAQARASDAWVLFPKLTSQSVEALQSIDDPVVRRLLGGIA